MSQIDIVKTLNTTQVLSLSGRWEIQLMSLALSQVFPFKKPPYEDEEGLSYVRAFMTKVQEHRTTFFQFLFFW